MKVLLINGSPNEHGCTYTALSETAETLQKHGIDTEILYLGKKPVAGCIACGKCRETGKCVFDDKVNEVIDKLVELDARPSAAAAEWPESWEPAWYPAEEAVPARHLTG